MLETGDYQHLPFFSYEEIDAVTQWVNDGGALFLIADHMPFPGAAFFKLLSETFNLGRSFAGGNHE